MLVRARDGLAPPADGCRRAGDVRRDPAQGGTHDCRGGEQVVAVGLLPVTGVGHHIGEHAQRRVLVDVGELDRVEQGRHGLGRRSRRRLKNARAEERHEGLPRVGVEVGGRRHHGLCERRRGPVAVGAQRLGPERELQQEPAPAPSPQQGLWSDRHPRILSRRGPDLARWVTDT
ncbi:hypothetical protein [Promicromonospora soli]